MTQPIPSRRERLMTTALELASACVPVLPLRARKLPVGNCPACRDNACGGRPNMKTAGACACPAPCHGWAAATTDAAVLASLPWAGAWREARAVAYHPGGAGLTVVDLDSPDAVVWARETLPPTRVVDTTRGEHWIYLGAMRGANNVRPGVDIKSLMAYARWLGPGTGTMVDLPDAVRALTVKQRPAPQHAAVNVSVPVSAGGHCRHRTPAYLERGIAMAEQHITEARSAVHHTVYRVFLAVLSTHGRCGCLTETHVQRLFHAAQAKGESVRHCAIAWANARTALGV